MNKDDIWRQIIQFVKEERWDDEYTPETDLVKDLKLNGDDAYEFIYLFSKKFNVSITEFKFEEYFYPEGDRILLKLLNLILKPKKKVKKKNNSQRFRKECERRKIGLRLSLKYL
ncbi:DUF1493 family protein [Bacteroides nordii]|uniref:DUF1493 family protein n=1 Tax=Bacteroides nordii TaxID=291645 RepID=UPI00210A540C|nr:DUF1493 family protein [Bacteroides nordii]MCQ4916960.1 DUF1493 family protein [Bacteroides nordii]